MISGKVRPSQNARASATIVVTSRPGARSRSSRQQLVVEIDGRHLVAVAGELERGAPGAGADVEDRAADPLRERPPEQEVRRVAAALQVVPDRLGHGLRPAGSGDQKAPTCPRRCSSWRSSSSAV